MNQDLWKRAEALFHAAIEQAPEDRRRFLECACADDVGLRRLVETLVSNDEHPGNFLAKPALAGALDATSGESLVGRQYGRYRILALLGVGGMGEV